MRRFRQKWYGGETISIGIGQGYNAFTLLQLAHATATLANDGVVMKPPSSRASRIPSPARSGRPCRRRATASRSSPSTCASSRGDVDVNISGTGAVPSSARPTGRRQDRTAQWSASRPTRSYDASKVDERTATTRCFIAFAPAGPGEKAGDRHRGPGRERRLRRAGGGADRARRLRLLPARQAAAGMEPLKSDRLPPEAARPAEAARLAQAQGRAVSDLALNRPWQRSPVALWLRDRLLVLDRRCWPSSARWRWSGW